MACGYPKGVFLVAMTGVVRLSGPTVPCGAAHRRSSLGPSGAGRPGTFSPTEPLAGLEAATPGWSSSRTELRTQ